MEITIFAKRRQSRDGKGFYSYLATLPRKDGSGQVVSVKFKRDCELPRAEFCPMNIEIPREAMSMQRTDYVREDTGEPATSYTLWIAAWSQGSEYKDSSLDEFEV